MLGKAVLYLVVLHITEAAKFLICDSNEHNLSVRLIQPIRKPILGICRLQHLCNNDCILEQPFTNVYSYRSDRGGTFSPPPSRPHRHSVHQFLLEQSAQPCVPLLPWLPNPAR